MTGSLNFCPKSITIRRTLPSGNYCDLSNINADDISVYAYYAFEAPALYLKFGVRIAMFLTAVIIWKKYREQKIIVLAFFCTVVSGFYFSFVRAIDSNLVNRDLYGMIGFILAYLFLVAAFQGNGT